jgi:hypothetical protein
MKKLLLTLSLVISIVALTSTCFACQGEKCKTDGNVMDSNEGQEGQILMYDCRNGNTDVGKWVDSDFLKGEKGDRGEAGQDGRDGIDGQDGRDGIDGQDGRDGIDGQDGRDGIDGQDGKDGEKGEKGDRGERGAKGDRGERGETGASGKDGENGVNGQDGKDGASGQDGQDGENGKDGKKGDKGDKGDTGKTGKKGNKGERGLQGERGRGLEDRYELIGELRLLDTRKTTWSVYAGRDFNNDVNIYGAKCVIKLGTSYEERRLDELEKKINALTEETGMNNIEVVPYGNNGLKIKTNF